MIQFIETRISSAGIKRVRNGEGANKNLNMEKVIRRKKSYLKIESITDEWMEGKITFDIFIMRIFTGFRGIYPSQRESYCDSITEVMKDKNLTNFKP